MSGQKIGPDPFTFGPWKVESAMGTILGKEGLEQVETELAMTSLPDMIFSSNFLTMRYKDEFEMKFSARDALNTCDKTHCPDVQVAAADSWIYG